MATSEETRRSQPSTTFVIPIMGRSGGRVGTLVREQRIETHVVSNGDGTTTRQERTVQRQTVVQGADRWSKAAGLRGFMRSLVSPEVRTLRVQLRKGEVVLTDGILETRVEALRRQERSRRLAGASDRETGTTQNVAATDQAKERADAERAAAKEQAIREARTQKIREEIKALREELANENNGLSELEIAAKRVLILKLEDNYRVLYLGRNDVRSRTDQVDEAFESAERSVTDARGRQPTAEERARARNVQPRELPQGAAQVSVASASEARRDAARAAKEREADHSERQDRAVASTERANEARAAATNSGFDLGTKDGRRAAADYALDNRERMAEALGYPLREVRTQEQMDAALRVADAMNRSDATGRAEALENVAMVERLRAGFGTPRDHATRSAQIEQSQSRSASKGLGGPDYGPDMGRSIQQ